MARTVAGGVIMGGGIATMHYTGMAAMRQPAMGSYDPWILTLSVVLAIVISLIALWLTFRLREGTVSFGGVLDSDRNGSSYTGHALHGYGRGPVYSLLNVPDTAHAVTTSTLGITGVSAVTALVLGVAVLTYV